MDNDNFFDTYLYLGPNKLKIFTKKKFYAQSIYDNEIVVQTYDKKNELEELDNFLNENIFKIEQKTNNFVKDIILILEHKTLMTVKISIKRNYYGQKIKDINFNHLLKDAKNQFEQNYKNRELLHMIIERYLIDNNSFSELPNDLICNYISLDLSFISLETEFIKNLEEVLKKYHIKVNKIISATYVKEFNLEGKNDLFLMTEKLLEGFNSNEILFVSKSQKKQGFFEKFFHLFS